MYGEIWQRSGCSDCVSLRKFALAYRVGGVYVCGAVIIIEVLKVNYLDELELNGNNN